MKVLYHANCNDGMGAALATWLRYGDELEMGFKIDYIPVQYGEDPPPIQDGEYVYMVDFSYPRRVILEMAIKASGITILDHHKTAEAELCQPWPDEHEGNDLCPIETIFDMDKSGAVLAWEHFHRSDKIIPLLFKHIQDRDLWSKKYKDSDAIATALSARPNWREWNVYIDQPVLVAELATEGESIDRFLAVKSQQIVETPPQYWEIGDQEVPVYNLPGFMISNTLHLALERYPGRPYAVAYFDLPGKRVYSLRSRRGSNVDVSAIARKNGGGGHMHAAGFTKELPTL